jgi:hypothetical protein
MGLDTGELGRIRLSNPPGDGLARVAIEGVLTNEVLIEG